MPETLGKMCGVEFFASGHHKPDRPPWSDADLRAMVRNFELNKDIFRPPVTLGHAEGAPKVGSVGGVSAAADLFSGDVVDLVPWMEPVLRHRMYDSVSAEVYRQPPPGCKGEGPMLRKLTLSGGDIPVVKRLNPAGLPPAVWEAHSEALARERPWAPAGKLVPTGMRETEDGAVEFFSELVPETFAEKKFHPIRRRGKKWAVYGRSGQVLGEHESREKALTQLRAVEHSMHESHAEDAVTPAEMKHQLVSEHGHDANMLESMPPEHIAYLHHHACKGKKKKDGAEKYAEQPTTPPVPQEGESAEAFSERHLAWTRAEAGRIAERTQAEQERIARSNQDILRGQHDALVDKFCEQMLAEGRLTPADMDATSPFGTAATRLKKLDPFERVEKFAEGGKETLLSAREMDMERIRRLPAQKFGEKVRGGQAGAAAGSEPDAEVAAVEKFAETHAEFQKELKPAEFKASLKEGFEAARKTDPALTAAKFLGV